MLLDSLSKSIFIGLSKTIFTIFKFTYFNSPLKYELYKNMVQTNKLSEINSNYISKHDTLLLDLMSQEVGTRMAIHVTN
jgi:hypothetical protein